MALLALLALPCAAAPAPWYQWRSLADGALFCAQFSPGAGWERVAGPFDNARCAEQPGRSLL
ncbi:MAG: hypothetical protein ABWY06_06155 [Pseudomonas sp.]|uniref:hypothetical protein n=1 Tax=Pseudomonas sp. TaxID=306 RepID=UPI0033952854